MGQTDFEVIVEKQPVMAGGKLCGAVYIDAEKQISGSMLIVSLTGEEKAVVNYEEGDWSARKMIPKRLKPVVKGVQSGIEMLQGCFDSNDHNDYKRHRTKDASVRIFSVEIPVGTEDMINNKKIEPGKYKMPFEIDLPPSIPATMYLQVEDGNCEIEYQLEAQLKGSGWFNDFKAHRGVHIQARPADESNMVVPYEAPPETMPIRLAKCKNLGEMTYACNLDNTVLEAGKPTQVTIACLNHSTLGVSSVVAEMIQVTSWEASGFESEHEKAIFSRSFPQWPDLDPIADDQITLGASSADKANIEAKLFEELKTGAHQITINVPVNATPSYEGQLISIKHLVRVRLVSQYHIDFVAPCPKLDIPVQVLATNKNMNTPVVNLPAWAADVANFVVATAVSASVQDFQYQGIIVEDEEEDAPVPVIMGEPSFEALLTAMKKTSNDLGLVSQKVVDPAWKSVFAKISPADLGIMLKEVNQDFRKTAVADLVARTCDNFVCSHVLAALRESPEWMRTAMVVALLYHAKDLETNKSMVLKDLTDWEKLVVEDALKEQQEALAIGGDP